MNLFLIELQWLHTVFLAALGLCCFVWAFSSCMSGGYSAAACSLLIAAASLTAERSSRCEGFVAAAHRLSSCCSQVLELRAHWRTGLGAQRHVQSSWTRDRACVSCTGRWTLHHWATRGAQLLGIFILIHHELHSGLWLKNTRSVSTSHPLSSSSPMFVCAFPLVTSSVISASSFWSSL